MILKKLLIFCVLLILSNISLADIEDEVYSPEYGEISNNQNSENLQNLKKNYNFKNLITCIFKKDEYKRIFRFGTTEDDEFFYRQPIKLNFEIDGYAGEKILLKKKSKTFNLKISKEFEKLDLLIYFDKKKSKLTKNNKFIGEVDCK